MAMILFNPTNEKFETQYIGETVIIDAGKKVRVDDPRGRHVLNSLGPRGLVALEYGDEGDGEEKKTKEGRERNKAFKRKMVIEFNTLNEQRFQRKLAYLIPTKQLQEYAKELGIGLREPYNVEDAAAVEISEYKGKLEEKDRKLEKQEKQIEELTAQMAEMSAMFKTLIKNVGESEPDDEETEKTESTGLDVSYKKLGERRLADWLYANWNLINKYPEKEKEAVAKKFERIYQHLMPATKKELEKFIKKQAA